MYQFGDEELKALSELFAKKKLYRYSVSGQTECDRFEEEFSRHIGVIHSLLLSSGTNALVVALLSSGLKPGDEVIIPSYTFFATASAVVQAGCIPIIANVDEELGLDPKEIDRLITPRTRAVIPVHMDGLSANLDPILEKAKNHGLVVIEDVAQAIGGSYHGKRLGSYGLFGCYSLNENKNISCGEGGIVTTNDRTLFETALCHHDPPAQFSPAKKEFFQNIKPFIGGSMRVSEIQGAIMRVQLSRLENILAGLRERKAIYLGQLRDLSNVRVVKGHCAEGDCASALHLTFEDPLQAAEFGKKLRDRRHLFAPVTLRPAHVSWKWSHLLGERASLQDSRNPFLNNPHSPNYENSDILPSVDILSRTLKLDIDFNLSLEETEALARDLRSTLHGS